MNGSLGRGGHDEWAAVKAVAVVTASALIQIELKEVEVWNLTASAKNPIALKRV